ncbi:hypothetical protein AB1N83_010851 [Pleurotus pulmonarius]
MPPPPASMIQRPVLHQTSSLTTTLRHPNGDANHRESLANLPEERLFATFTGHDGYNDERRSCYASFYDWPFRAGRGSVGVDLAVFHLDFPFGHIGVACFVARPFAKHALSPPSIAPWTPACPVLPIAVKEATNLVTR